MKKALKVTGIILAMILIGGAIAWFGFLRPEPPPISPEDRLAVNLMPLPSSLELKGGKLYLSSAPKLSEQRRLNGSDWIGRLSDFHNALPTELRFGQG